MSGENSDLTNLVAAHVVASDRILVMVSGGPDSMLLLSLLNRLRLGLRFILEVAHINYGLRGSDSEADEALVRRYAERAGLGGHFFSVSLSMGSAVQERARKERWGVMRRLVQDFGFDKLMLAHHADDQLETILMNWMRGAGLRGLRGMLPVTRFNFGSPLPPVQLIRPFLSVTKQQILSCCSAQGIAYREDLSNATTTYLRNRVRHGLIPRLVSKPGLYGLMARSQQALASQLQRADAAVTKLLSSRSGLSLQEYFKLDLAERYLAIEALLRHGGTTKMLAREVFDRIDSCLAQGQKKISALGLVLRVDGDCLSMERSQSTLEYLEPVSIPGPGNYPLKAGRLRISRLNSDQFNPSSVPPGLRPLYLDADQVRFPLTVRSATAGDRFRPIGLSGTKKLSDFYIDLKIPRRLRPGIPIIESQGTLVGVLGYALDERYRVTKDSSAVFKVELAKS